MRDARSATRMHGRKTRGCRTLDAASKTNTRWSEMNMKHTVVLAHGLLGFDELRLAGQFLPGIQYWRGIKDALAEKGIEVIVAAVPASGSIEARAVRLAEDIAQKAQGKAVNIIA
ncbi:hypothetical protein DPSP01_009380 [Paraphaeosphaeria sporulosa]